MNCRRCHHTDEIHKSTTSTESILRRGACQIPDCTCNQFLDAFEEIDDEQLQSYIGNKGCKDMDKHAPKEEMIKDLENILAKINALEVNAKDEESKANVKILRKLTEGQIHSINEFDHLKKAIDLLTMQLFDVKDKINSK